MRDSAQKSTLSIVHINTHDVAGGAAKSAWRLAAAQRARGHDAKLLVGYKGSGSGQVCSFPREPHPLLKERCRREGQLFYEFQGSHKLTAFPLVCSADVIHLHNLHGGYFNPFSLAPLSQAKPVVWTLRDMQAITGHCAHAFDCRKWEEGCGGCPALHIEPALRVDTSAQLLRDKKYIYDHSCLQLVAPSEWLKGKVARSVLKSHPIELIYNAVDTQIFKPRSKAEIRRKYAIPEGAFVLGAVAHGGAIDNQWKGGRYTKEALEQLWSLYPNLLFLNIGAEKASAHAKCINIPHVTSEEDLAGVYSILDVFLYTPLADTCPLVVIEALSCGVPIVSFATGGVPELVRDGQDGFITPCKDVHELVRAVTLLIGNARQRSLFSHNARKNAVARFDIAGLDSQYQQLYEKVIERRVRAGRRPHACLFDKVPEVIRTEAFFSALQRQETAITMPQDSPQISILVPTKDRPEHLQNLLRSIPLSARDLPYEVLILYAQPDSAALKLAGRREVVLFIQEDWFASRPTWPQMMNFMLSRARGKYFMYASDDICFEADALHNAFQLLEHAGRQCAGAAMAYKNVVADSREWSEFGVDLTLGDQVLINYGLLRTDAARQAGGFSDAYRFYCADGDLCLRLIDRGYRIIPAFNARVVHNNILDVSKQSNNALAAEDITTYRATWCAKFFDIQKVKRMYSASPSASQTKPEGAQSCAAPQPKAGHGPPLIPAAVYADDFLKEQGVIAAGQSVKLHLGCGEQHFEGYINIDYPPSRHTVMHTRAEVHADLLELDFHDGSVEEIRLHHVFEHFNRVTALALLIRWHRWLKTNGTLRIETPDIAGSARMLASDASYALKMAAVRHLAGDHSAAWAYHVDHWFPERFERTLRRLGFECIEIKTSAWPKPPYLANVEARATKARDIPLDAQLAAAEELLWESTVSAQERPTWEIWRKQLRGLLKPDDSLAPDSKAPAALLPDKEHAPAAFATAASPLPLKEIHDFNQRCRDRWVGEKAQATPAGSRVLDVGAGTCPYRKLFAHCDYKTHDFRKFDGIKLGGTTEYGTIDYTSEITQLPVPDSSFDVVLCTEVLEHVPEPIEALREMSRVLRPGGRLLLTAPLGSGLHQMPYHFYGGYTPEWYKHFGKKYGLDVVAIKPNGGFFKMLAQESARVAWTLPQHRHLHGEEAAKIQELFGETLPRYLFSLDDKCCIDQFTVGYHVEMIKKNDIAQTVEAPAPRSQKKTACIVFSKDRPLQLDATLRSLFAHGKDMNTCSVTVLYATSTPEFDALYRSVIAEHPPVAFVQEQCFKQDLLSRIAPHDHVLFLVDDNIFVRDFALGGIVAQLNAQPDALGFSLRLGKNTTYCYALNRPQQPPLFQHISDGMLQFNWTGAEHDFGYPLEVSSSVYRVREILPLLEQLSFSNPNTLEVRMAELARRNGQLAPLLLCFERSVTFCAPVNKVQADYDNRSGGAAEYSAEELAKLFAEGKRLAVGAYDGFVPNACHQEVAMLFELKRAAAPAACTGSTAAEQIQQAEQLIQNNQFAEADALLSALVTHEPHNPEALNDLAVLRYYQGNPDEALRCARSVLDRDPSNTAARENIKIIEAARPHERTERCGSDAAAAPLVSVVIPCYNQAHFLPEAVESVVRQTCTDWECIIVNDGSPDATREAANKLIARYPGGKIRLLEKENGGLADARNAGIAASRGVYWLPLDADDRLHPEFLEKTVRVLEKHPRVGFVYCDIQHFGACSRLWRLPAFDGPTLVHHDNTGCVCSLTRKAAWEQVGGYTTAMREGYEDWDFWIGCIEKGWSGYHLNEPLFYYRKKEQTFLKDANKKRAYLISRIVLNHPALYPPDYLHLAAKTISAFADSRLEYIPVFEKVNFGIDEYFARAAQTLAAYTPPAPQRQEACSTENPPRENDRQRPSGPAGRSGRILFAFPYYLPLQGGVEEVIKNISIRLGRRGWEVTVACRPHPDRTSKKIDGARIAEFDITGCSSRGYTGEPDKFIAFLKAGHFDIVCTLGTSTWTADLTGWNSEKIPGKKVWVPTGYYNIFNPVFWKLYKRLPDFIAGFDAVIQLSDGYRDAALHGLLSLQHAVTIPNGVDPGLFRQCPSDFREKYGIDKNKKIILHVSNHFYNKGHRDIRQAFARSALEDYCLVMIGNRETYGRAECFQECCAASQASVYNLTGVPRQDVHAAFCHADIYIQASRYECFPVVLLEAMASGTPFVSTDAGSAKELGGGIVVPRQELHRGLRELALNRGLHERLKTTGLREIQERYSWERVIDKYEALFADLRGDRLSKAKAAVSCEQLRKIVAERCAQGALEEALWYASFALQHAKHDASLQAVIKDFSGEFFGKLPIAPADLHYHTGNVAVQQQDMARAAACYAAALKSDARHRPTIAAIQLLEQKLGEQRRSLSCGQYAGAEKKPQDSRPRVCGQDTTTGVEGAQSASAQELYARGRKALEHNDLQAAITAFDTILEQIDPLDRETVKMVRRLEKRLGDPWREAREKYFFSKCAQTADEQTCLLAAQFHNSSRVMRFLYNSLRNEQTASGESPADALVSIIIPCHNCEGKIDTTVQSVLRQTYRNWELVLVDDGSDDDTWQEVLRQKEHDAARISVRRLDKNSGVSCARNAGAKFASGKHLVFLDAGDEILPRYLETLVGAASNNQDIAWFYPITLQIGEVNRLWSFQDFSISENLSRNLQPVTSLLRKEVFDQLGGFPEQFRDGYEDWCFWIRAIKKGFRGTLIRKILFVYHKEEASRNIVLQRDRVKEFQAKLAIIQQNREFYVPIGEAEKKRLCANLRIEQGLINREYVRHCEKKSALPSSSKKKLTVQFYVYKNVHWPMFEALYHFLKKQDDVGEIIICLPDLPQLIGAQHYALAEKLMDSGATIVANPRARNVDVTFIADTIAGKVAGCGKIVNVGHGTISKGYYFTESFWTERENWVDLLCVPGPYAAERFANVLKTRVAATGMPKLDPVFSGAFNRRYLCELLHLHPEKKIVLYAPTFNIDLSSVYDFEKRFDELRRPDDVYLLVKLHGSTLPQTVAAYRRMAGRFDDIIFIDDPNIAPYIGGADIMISDVSSASMEFMALDKPVLLYNNPRQEHYHGYNRQDIEYAWRDLATEADSFDELKVKLEALVRAGDDGKSSVRRRYAERLFADRTGRACGTVWAETKRELQRGSGGSARLPLFSDIVLVTDENCFAVRSLIYALQLYAVLPHELVLTVQTASGAAGKFAEQAASFTQFERVVVVQVQTGLAVEDALLEGVRKASGDIIMVLGEAVQVYKNYDYVVYKAFQSSPATAALTGVTNSDVQEIHYATYIPADKDDSYERLAYECINRFQGAVPELCPLSKLPPVFSFRRPLMHEAGNSRESFFVRRVLPKIRLCKSLLYSMIAPEDMNVVKTFWKNRGQLPLEKRLSGLREINRCSFWPDVLEQELEDMLASGKPVKALTGLALKSIAMRFYDAAYKKRLLERFSGIEDFAAILRRDIALIEKLSGTSQSKVRSLPPLKPRGCRLEKRVLFYFFKNVHIPVMVPIYKKLKQLHPEAGIAFGYMQHAPQIRAGFAPEELRILKSYGEQMFASPQEFRPDLTFIADSVYPWVQGCGKLVNVGHGVLSKGQYYTDTATARREEQADSVCVPGRYHESIMKKIISKPVAATGMAKLDCAFSGAMTRSTIIRQYGLPQEYRYILFAPTFNDELSAIPFVEDRIGDVLTDDRTVLIIKLHGSTKQEYQRMYRRLVEKDPRIIFADELDITPLLVLADVMISDVSSAMMEFAALDKPLVLFNNPTWTSYQNYNPADIEFCWRDIGIQVHDLQQMKEAVRHSLARPKELCEKRTFYADQLFANKYDGRASERIIQEALSLFDTAYRMRGAA